MLDCLINSTFFLATANRCMSKVSTETDAEFDARYEAYFNRADIDGWEIRKVIILMLSLNLYIFGHWADMKWN